MNATQSNFAKIIYLSALCGVSACAPTLDGESVRARAVAPEAARVDEVNIPRSPNAEKIYFVIQPVRVVEEGTRKVSRIQGRIEVGKDGQCEGCVGGQASIITSELRNYLLARQRQISLQLASAISGVEDFGLLDYEAFRANPNKVANGKNVHILKAVITEMNYRIRDEKSKFAIPLTFSNKKGLVEGVVGLDVSATNARTGETIASFATNGTFITKSQSTRTGLVSSFLRSDVKVRSTVDQALRAALNSAAIKMHGKLYR